jgi:hypothetical protein
MIHSGVYRFEHFTVYSASTLLAGFFWLGHRAFGELKMGPTDGAAVSRLRERIVATAEKARTQALALRFLLKPDQRDAIQYVGHLDESASRAAAIADAIVAGKQYRATAHEARGLLNQFSLFLRCLHSFVDEGGQSKQLEAIGLSCGALSAAIGELLCLCDPTPPSQPGVALVNQPDLTRNNTFGRAGV